MFVEILKTKFSFWKFCALVWILSIIIFVISLTIATNFFRGTIQATTFGNSPMFLIFFSSSILVGSISFVLAVIAFSLTKIKRDDENSQKKHNKIYNFFRFFLTLAILPLLLLVQVLQLKKILSLIKNRGLLKAVNIKTLIIKLFMLFFVGFMTILWAGGYLIVGVVIANSLGYVSEDLNIVGTGSMYPTWPKGTKGKDPKELAKEIVSTAGFLPYPNGLTIGGRTIFGHTLGRGDIITWENDTTRTLTSQDGAEPAGLLKRLIGLPGDTIELRDGIVYLNGKPQKEPYIAKPRSTFGEKFLKECQVITVPKNEIFAMGDNRKGSADSREIGFAPIKDISRVLPLSKQKGNLDKNWHDTSKDFDESSKIKIDKQQYLDLLNEKRKEAGAKPLKYQSKLEDSASRRGEVILKYDDFSFEATRSGYTQLRAMNDAHYSNITYGEAPTLGYYEANELVDNQFEFPETKKFLLNKDYQDIGISEVQGTLNGCPVQVIVQHFAGYVPPNYEKDVVDSWKNALSGLRGIQPNWEALKNNANFYSHNKQDVDRITQIISIRISNIEGIVVKMDSNQWLTSDQDNYTKSTDQSLANEEETLANKLNNWRP